MRYLIFLIPIILFFSCKEEKKNLVGFWNMTETTCVGFEGVRSFEFSSDTLYLDLDGTIYVSDYEIDHDVLYVRGAPTYDIVKVTDEELTLLRFSLECLYYFEK